MVTPTHTRTRSPLFQCDSLRTMSSFVFAGAIGAVAIRRISNVARAGQRRDAESAIIRNVVFSIIDGVRHTEAIRGIGRPCRRQLRVFEATITRPNTAWNGIRCAAGILVGVSAGSRTKQPVGQHIDVHVQVAVTRHSGARGLAFIATR